MKNLVGEPTLCVYVLADSRPGAEGKSGINPHFSSKRAIWGICTGLGMICLQNIEKSFLLENCSNIDNFIDLSSQTRKIAHKSSVFCSILRILRGISLAFWVCFRGQNSVLGPKIDENRVKYQILELKVRFFYDYEVKYTTFSRISENGFYMLKTAKYRLRSNKGF